jgi:hypothetical protein
VSDPVFAKNQLLKVIYFSETTSISKSSLVKTSPLLKAPSLHPKISAFLKPADFRSHEFLYRMEKREQAIQGGQD